MEAQQLVAGDHIKLAKFIAKLFKRSNRNQDFDDIESDAMFGLALAIDSYDPKRGASFETYARFRIKGTIVDGIRQRRWGGRTKTDRELNAQSLKAEMKEQQAVSEEEVHEPSEIVFAIEELTGREQTILRMYYWHAMTMKQIGEEFGISVGRISQLHKVLLEKLKHAHDC